MTETLTDYFQKQTIRDGVASILQTHFKLDLSAEQMDSTTEIIFETLNQMPIYTADEDGELDMESELFFYLLHMMLRNMMLNAKLKALQEVLDGGGNG